MRIVVTGAGGFIGRRVIRRLIAEAHHVTAIVHPDSVARVQTDLPSSEIHLLPLDLQHLDPALLPVGADALITLGQARAFREFPAKAEEIFAVNVVANLRLLQWAIGARVPQVVHASSGGIYGGRRKETFHESDLVAVDSPLGFYLGTKLCAEIVLQNYRHHFQSTVILRPFFVYGPGQRRDMFIARLIDSVRSGSPIRLQGPNGLRVNPVYVDDAADAFVSALGLTGYHLINVGGPDVLTLREICDAIGGAVGKLPVFEHQPGEPVDYVGDILQASAKLRCIRTSFAEGLERTVNAVGLSRP
jgi:nucleoside-diphosphate-sugar epimerase